MIKAAGPNWLGPGLIQITQKVYRGQSLGRHLRNAFSSWAERIYIIRTINRLLKGTWKRGRVESGREK
ncbi:hypothetical protein HMPREF2909_02710 [Alloscardovia sp. HMSC034E08]|nr:hypothetical protein HMPREF2909_02710 [Alloscardovia sp. HMSC034E08]